MGTPKLKPASSPLTRRKVIVHAIWIIVLAALPIITNAWWDHPGVLFGLAAGYLVIGIMLQSRLILCTLAGIVFGLLAIDPNARRLSENYQVWQPVWAVGAGTLIGLVVGFIWDRGAEFSLVSRSSRQSRR